jgi:hypothetical protein
VGGVDEILHGSSSNVCCLGFVGIRGLTRLTETLFRLVSEGIGKSNNSSLSTCIRLQTSHFTIAMLIYFYQGQL